MNNIGIGSGGNYFDPEDKNVKKDENAQLEDIKSVFTTELQENKRGSFNETFNTVNIGENADKDWQMKHIQRFTQSFLDNKESLMQELGITEEVYDTFACTALALASQETGMGLEEGYAHENKNFFGVIGRFFGKTYQAIFDPSGSVSSGLTQMKINDWVNDKDKLSDELKQVLKNHNVDSGNYYGNNLFDNPDKAAIATIVILKSINDNYDDYKNMLENEHSDIASVIASDPEQLPALEAKGNQLLDDILDIYKNADDKGKIEIRNAFKSWMLAVNGSKIGQRTDNGFNEEENLNKFNEILSKYNPDFETLSEDSLHYIRYALTAPGKEMTPIEYMAYGWNKGIGKTGMQLDRTLADKIGTILYNPEDFDYDQFTTNVSMLTEKYASQAGVSLEHLNQTILDEYEW